MALEDRITRVSPDKLKCLFSGAVAKLSNISLINPNLGKQSTRRRTIQAHSINDTLPRSWIMPILRLPQLELRAPPPSCPAVGMLVCPELVSWITHGIPADPYGFQFFAANQFVDHAEGYIQHAGCGFFANEYRCGCHAGRWSHTPVLAG
jgi:hypothetical protein